MAGIPTPHWQAKRPWSSALRTIRNIAHELGPRGSRALLPGPIKTRAASGLKDFDLLLNQATHRAPTGELVETEDVGMAAEYLATPDARQITDSTVYVDAGLNIMA
jgi:enoyl-[acyl-carrier protein] reductase I